MEPCQGAAHSSRIAASKTLSFMPYGTYLKAQKPLGCDRRSPIGRLKLGEIRIEHCVNARSQA